MAKSTSPYWNPLAPESRAQWTAVSGLEGMVEVFVVSGRLYDQAFDLWLEAGH